MSRIFYLLVIVSLMSCQKDKLEAPIVIKKYLHLSHTRTDANPTIDSMAALIDYDQFDMLWLGGDLALETSKDDLTMKHVDSIFDLGSNKTLWALGNHDYTNLNRISRYTNRAPYYTMHQDGITLVVLDTQDSLSNIVGEQRRFLDRVLDTIESSSHLILLHHKMIWMYGNVDLEPQIPMISNGGLGNCYFCLNPNNFNAYIYPRLIEVKQRGIEVICIGGDIGFYVNAFEHQTAEGIHFLASGIENGKENNQILIFEHDLTNDLMNWEFKLVKDLVE